MTTTATHNTLPVRSNAVRDSWNVLVRELRPVVRDPFSLIFSLLQPLVFLGLFGPLLIGGSDAPAGEVLQWFVPGILVMIALFGTGVTGSNLLMEMQTGSHERTLVAPIARPALLIGRALKEMAPIMVQAGVIALATIPFGFSVNPLGMLLGLVLIAIFGMGFGALSYTLALVSRSRDWMFWAVQQATIFPLMILSGMLLPLEDGPRWMQVAAAFNPISYVVAAERALFAGELSSPDVLWGFLAAAVLAAIGLAVGIRSIKRSD
ncbi:ABC transporter permease [Arthrobacter glacialis]|uniref:Transport permease protein n=1 Tax=Arthrobacter glacialis TaxID=1664 RepID=A0A2S3ZU66_ARTGL|nr:ABC transporter permease [Arthrobacter glacialis]POH72723.1 multidrug ABC transporter permease [Arthrobacter glacialis]